MMPKFSPAATRNSCVLPSGPLRNGGTFRAVIFDRVRSPVNVICQSKSFVAKSNALTASSCVLPVSVPAFCHCV